MQWTNWWVASIPWKNVGMNSFFLYKRLRFSFHRWAQWIHRGRVPAEAKQRALGVGQMRLWNGLKWLRKQLRINQTNKQIKPKKTTTTPQNKINTPFGGRLAQKVGHGGGVGLTIHAKEDGGKKLGPMPQANAPFSWPMMQLRPKFFFVQLF